MYVWVCVSECVNCEADVLDANANLLINFQLYILHIRDLNAVSFATTDTYVREGDSLQSPLMPVFHFPLKTERYIQCGQFPIPFDLLLMILDYII